MNDSNKSCALIIGQSIEGVKISSVGGRISTTEGTVFDVLEKSQDNEKNIKLISKVLNSGHKTIIEHHNFNIAFNNVSVVVEQFMIEFRLASFTVKSRRYVDFSNAGYYMPKIEDAKKRKFFEKTTQNLFSYYKKALELGISKEDSRFFLPYNFKSNFICTCNARELLHIICTMIYGRGKVYDEILDLGLQLKSQLEQIYPDLVEKEKFKYQKYDNINLTPFSLNQQEISYKTGDIELLSHSNDVEKTLLSASKMLGIEEFDLKTILSDGKLQRILEQITFTFKINNISLPILTHFTRHRMHSLIVPNIYTILNRNTYLSVPSFEENIEAKKLYEKAIKETTSAIEKLKDLGPYILSYLIISGRTIDIMTTINARELLWLFKLRTCDRAQWEIRTVTKRMLKALKQLYPKIFENFGPSCLVDGYCPEGKLTCGKMKTPQDLDV